MKCEMVYAHHPDCYCGTCARHKDDQCSKLAVGVVLDSMLRVCSGCAKQMESEDFVVSYFTVLEDRV